MIIWTCANKHAKDDPEFREGIGQMKTIDKGQTFLKGLFVIHLHLLLLGYPQR